MKEDYEKLDNTLKENGIESIINNIMATDNDSTVTKSIIDEWVFDIISRMSFLRGSAFRDIYFGDSDDELEAVKYFLFTMAENEEEPIWSPSLDTTNLMMMVFENIYQRDKSKAHALRRLFVDDLSTTLEFVELMELELEERIENEEEEE